MPRIFPTLLPTPINLSMSTVDIIPLTALVVFVFTGFFMAKIKLSKIKKWIISITLMSSSMIMIFVYFNQLAPRYRDAFCINEITYFKGPNGNLILVQHNASVPSKVSISYSRLSVLDAETGKIMHTVVAGPSMSNKKELFLELVTDDKIWYSSYKFGLHARDPYTGKIVSTEKDIIKRYPQLNGSTKVQVKTDDGYLFESKPPDFNLKMISYPRNKLNSGESFIQADREPHHSTYQYISAEVLEEHLYNLDTSYFRLAWDHGIAIMDAEKGFCFENNDKDDRDVMQLMLARNTKYGYKQDSCLNNELNLRSPFIIENYLLKNPKSLLVGHYGYDEKRDIQFLMSRIDLDGNILWTLKQHELGGEPNIFSLNNGILYLAIKGKLVAIDPNTGSKKWSIQL